MATVNLPVSPVGRIDQRIDLAEELVVAVPAGPVVAQRSPASVVNATALPAP